MKLYVSNSSPNCRRVRVVLDRLGIAVDIDVLDVAGGDVRKPDFLRLNPNGMVPVLRDGDLVLWESNAIMQYVADQVPGNSLFPKDPKARADVQRWQCWELAHYNKALGALAFETIVKPRLLKAEPDATTVAWATPQLARFAPVLESHLQGRRYLVGDDVTLADYSVAFLEAAQKVVPFDWSAFPNVNVYYERMRADPYWVKSAPPNNPITQGAQLAATSA